MDTGAGGERIRALTFGGGAFDTVMQLGVAHALLVRNGKAPDHIVGISAGAINAAALAEILQAGRDLETPEQELAACVRKMREFINAYVDIPSKIVESTFPDAFEVNAQKALEPLELPVHFAEERQSRQDANRSRAGLILLINHFLRVRLTVAVITKMIRRVLAIRQSSELKLPKKNIASTRVWNYAGIWFAALTHSYAASQLVGTLAYAAIRGRRRYVQKSAGQIILAFRPLSVTWNAFKGAVAWILFLGVLLLPAAVLFRLPLPGWLANIVNRGIDASSAFFRTHLTKLLVSTTPLVVSGERLLKLAFGGFWRVLQAMTLGNPRFSRYITLFPIGQQLRAHGASLVLAGLAWLIALFLDLRFNVRGRWVLLAYLIVLSPMPLILGIWLVVLAATVLWPRSGTAISFTTRILEHYEVGDGILSADILLQELVHCFDSNYYGKHVVSEMNDAALQRADCVPTDVGKEYSPLRRVLSEYRKRQRPIHVAPVAANLSTGRLEILTETTSIVRALLAATATSPLFPASDVAEETRPQKKLLSRLFQKEKAAHPASTWYVDGLNISNEPIQPLLDHLRKEFSLLAGREATNKVDPTTKISEEHRARLRVLRKATTVDVYPVSDLPVDQGELESPGNYSTLVEVGLRAMELKQLRDAALERTLTRLYTATLRTGKAFVEEKDADGKSRVYIHAGIFPIELDRPAHVNRRIIRGMSVDERRTILHAAVADGCRASLEAMLAADLLQTNKLDKWIEEHIEPTLLADLKRSANIRQRIVDAIKSATPLEDKSIELPISVGERRTSVKIDDAALKLLVDLTNPRCRSIIEKRGQHLPENDPESGPGVPEICKQCRLYREEKAATVVPVKGAVIEPVAAAAFDDRVRLHGRIERLEWPIWPRDKPTGADRVQVPRQQQPPPAPGYDWKKEWPSRRKESQSEASNETVARPTVSFLFGGGVFRGVYHMGVMNALNEAKLQPDVIAGSSVGSIIAAMIASVFKEEDPTSRHLQIRSLSATFLAIDRFVLTDRLADFVRRFTLRGAEARFAPRDLDLVLRRYDIDFQGRFGKRARNLLAGLERLLYLSPFELFTIVRAARLQDFSCLLQEVLGDLQELLDRGAVGDEILGSEPLALLIQRQVEDPLRKLLDKREGEIRFDTFLEGKRKMYFLATTTNLMRGALEIIGAPNKTTTHVSLRQGLLASSAFPAVFRPRHGWEVFVGNLRRDDLYIDGGVMDNLPLDAVARFLSQAARDRKIVGRPFTAPHLLFTASLEITRDVLPMDPKAICETRRNFVDVRRRAKTFNLNRKIDAYRAVQKRLDILWKSQRVEKDWPLSLRVIAVKPNWLCGTFAFHPMLGFRRENQARSIAHGCATTLAELHTNAVAHDSWAKAWGIEQLDFDKRSVVTVPIPGTPQHKRVLTPRTDAKDGQCWFRVNEHLCPFSKQWRLTYGTKDPNVRPEELKNLHAIYVSCGQAATHRPKKG